MPDATYRHSPAVASTQIDDTSTVLLHLSKQTYFQLNGTGTRLWRHIGEQEEATPDELVDALHAEHGDVSRADVRADVQTFLRDLVAADLLEEV